MKGMGVISSDRDVYYFYEAHGLIDLDRAVPKKRRERFSRTA